MHIIVISYIVHVSCVCCLSVVVYVCVYIYIHTYIMCWSGPADLERVVVFSCFYCVRVCPVFIVFPCGVVSCVVSFHGLCLCVCCLAVVVYVFIYQLLVGPFGLGTLVVVIVVLLLLLLYLFVYLHIYIYIYILFVCCFPCRLGTLRRRRRNIAFARTKLNEPLTIRFDVRPRTAQQLNPQSKNSQNQESWVSNLGDLPFSGETSAFRNRKIFWSNS